ncbi:MAG TPA: serine/threonine-protein kinase [Candidatus Limnocylindria bacterium]|nr:serine/threonine-protein kinase [Candidatus Limnocylindria bacterium]
MDEPRILDRYRLTERIAAGGSAEVWRAHDEQLDRLVAIKRLHPHLLPDEASRRRLVAEARAAAALSHPVIVGVYDVDSTGESPALVMELVEGESLAARIERDGPLDQRIAAAITADVAEALYHAHQRGVIHRDVKPGNVLLASDGRTRLVDFGIAHSLAPSAERLTLAGTVMGTLSAMAPEQLTGGPITPRTDLYGLGVVLHEALTGRAPYLASSPVALAEAQRAGPPAMDGMDPALASLVGACLAYEPTMRPLHAGALAAALRDWLAGDPAAALAMAPMRSASVDTAAITRPMPRVAQPATPAVRPRRRVASLAWPIAALALVALAAVAAAAVLPGIGPRSGAAGPSQSAALPTEPAWLAGLVERVEAACGSESAGEAESSMAPMDEATATKYADDLVAGCQEAQAANGGREGKENGSDKGKGNGKKGKDD